SEGRAWLERALRESGSGAGVPPASRARALQGVGLFAGSQHDWEIAGATVAECVDLFRALDDKPGLIDSYCAQVFVLALRDSARARQVGEEGLSIARAAGYAWGTARLLQYMGTVAHTDDDPRTARRLYEESLDI